MDTDRRNLATGLQYEMYKRDFALFAKEQLRIKGAGPGQILPLDLNVKPMQMLVWRKIKEQLAGQGFVRGYILKGRQQGSSTVTQGIMYWKSSTMQNFDTMLMAHDAPTTQKLFQIARHFYDHVQPAFKPMTRYSSKSELTFENPDPRTRFERPGLRSHMDFTDASKPLAGTSQTRQGLHLTEAAKYNEDTTHVLAASFIPMIHDLPGTYYINESTAFTRGLWFRAGCEEARSRKSRYFWVFSPWYNDPEYQLPLEKNEHFILTPEERHIVALAAKGQAKDEVRPITVTREQLKWRREKISEFEFSGMTSNGEQLFNQEFPLDFDSAWISFDEFVFDRQAVFELQRKVPNPELGRLETGGLNRVRWYAGTGGREEFGPESDYRAIWEHPKPGKQYDIAVDVAGGGEEGDWSVIQVLERFSNKQVAEVHIHVDPTDLAEELYQWGRYYNWGAIAVEFNSIGITVNSFIQRVNYPNIYFWRLRSGAYPKVTKVTGWKTNRESKTYLVSIARSKFIRKECTINSKWLLHEMSNFTQWPSGEIGMSYGASVGHDDLVLAWMIVLTTSDDESAGMTPETNVNLRPKDPGIVDVAFQDPGTAAERRALQRLYERKLGGYDGDN